MTSQIPDPDELARLQRTVANLPRRQRDIFLAHRLDNLTYAEIAERTGFSRKRVMAFMAKALFNISRQSDGHPLRWWERRF
jgi:RNA polymerase sigma-70 factor (ECF subfamily)